MNISQKPSLARGAVALAAALLLGACGDSGSGSEPVDTVEISLPAPSVEEGATMQLATVAKGASGKTLSRKTATWTSSNTFVAEISTSGELRGKTQGATTVTATVDGITATTSVQVVPATVASVSVPATSVPALTSTSARLDARDARGNPITSRVAEWTIADTTIAVVNQAGTVTGRRLGSTTVTAKVEGKSGSGTVTVTASTVNFSVAGVTVNQGSQTRSGAIPLIAGRDGWLRVFATANVANESSPRVRVQLVQDGAVVSTTVLSSATNSVGASVDDGNLSTSWNMKLPGALVRPGLAVQVEINPDGELSEANTGDNLFPATAPQPLNVQASYPHRVVLVPVHQSASGLTGNITAADTARFVSWLKKLFPLPSVETTVRATFTSGAGALQANDENGAWSTTLSELNALRVADNSTAYYYGVLKLPYSGGGIAGLGYVGGYAAVGYDAQNGGPIVYAHEVGHNFGRRHAPCGSVGGADASYPHAGGTLGSHGMDIVTGELKDSALRDIMSYCYEWVSDYTYLAVMDYRASLTGAARQMTATATAAPTRSLLLWGSVGNGQAKLEPAFEITSRPVLPARPGPHAVEALDAAGNRIFTFTFQAEEVADLPSAEGHFAFSVPVSEADADRIATLRLVANGRRVERRATLAPRLSRTGADAGAAALRRTANGVEVRWDAARFPMVMVRDAASGQVLGFARNGNASVAGRAGEVELVFSDGVRSQSRRMRVPAR